jgi:ribonucleoside-triphosphate reductase (thioredoxin)
MEKNGLRSLGELTYLRTYSKNAEENFGQTVERYLDFWRARFPELVKQINGYGEVLHSKQAVGSMRLYQFSGEAVNITEARAYNCVFVSPTSFQDYADICYLLCSGCGVGSSVESHYVNQLPDVPEGFEQEFTIPDDKEGWADSFALLLKNRKIKFNYELVRPAGAKLSSGGTASGPGPLRNAHEEIRRVLGDKTRLSSEDDADIICLIAQAVVSGGSRRSAIIILSDVYDPLMRNYKSGNWWDTNKHRAKANISSVAKRGTDEVGFALDEQLESPFGERGVVLVNERDYSGNIGTNPCGEISLKNRSFCNLSEVIVSNCSSEEDFFQACRAASFFGTLQASLTNFKYIHPDFKRNSEEEALLGVSLTGQAQAGKWFTEECQTIGADIAVRINQTTARKIGTRPAKRVTTTKPSGTTSCVMGTTSGVHAAAFEYGVRRIRVTRLSPLGIMLINQFGISEGVAVETAYGTNVLPVDKYAFIVPEVYEEKDVVLQFPCHYKDAIYQKDEGAIALLERCKRLYHSWIIPGHIEGNETANISLTVAFHPHEKDGIKQWALDNQDSYRAISTLPHVCGYELLPFEELTKEEYDKYYARFPDIDLSSLGVSSEATTTTACSGGQCEVV